MSNALAEEMVRAKAEQSLKEVATYLYDNAEEWGRGLPYADIVRIIKEVAIELPTEEDEE